MRCVHCDKKSDRFRRGLCSSCYNRRDLRTAYPRQAETITTKDGKLRIKEDSTMEEVEKVIAEVVAEGLPAWFHEHEHKIRKGWIDE